MRVMNFCLFDKPGIQNTELLINIVNEFLMSTDIKIDKLVISSTTGYTYKILHDKIKFNGEKLVCCQDMNEVFYMPDSTKKDIIKKGYKLYEIPRKFLISKIGIEAVRILRNISQGTKVCFEMMEFLLFNKLIDESNCILLIAGTLKGADTAIVLRNYKNNNYKVEQILCLPVSEPCSK